MFGCIITRAHGSQSNFGNNSRTFASSAGLRVRLMSHLLVVGSDLLVTYLRLADSKLWVTVCNANRFASDDLIE